MVADPFKTTPSVFGHMLQKITALRIQKKNRRRVSIFLDGRYAFGVQASVAARLSVGQTLSAEEIEQLQERDEIEVTHERALNYLSYRPRSCAETALPSAAPRVPCHYRSRDRSLVGGRVARR